jgi:2-polyprenyl-6-methoxyphenol hydroxylase-like FAD-dependent oxidoreductase
MATLKVIIIGGGLAGACLANGLINKSDGQIDVAVFERDEAGSERGGYQIRLGAHALIGFKACLTQEQYANLLPCFGKSGGVVSSAPCIFSPSDLKVLIDLSKAPVYEKSAPIARTRLRNFLQKPLQERDAIQFGKKYVRYEVLEGKAAGQNNIRVHFSDNTHRDCDVLISAEGSGSRINKQIGLNNIITEVKPGHGGYLGKCHLPWSVLQTLPRQLLEKGTIYTGNSKAMVFAAVYLPESMSTKRTPNSDGTDPLKPQNYDEDEASLFLGMAWTTGPEAAELPQVEDKKVLMKKKLTEAGFHPDFYKLVDAVDNEAIMTTPWRYAKNETPIDWRRQLLSQHENKPDPSIANARVWLIGDSIHPMLPSRGMGANNAIHDTADALGPLLELAKLKSLHGNVTDDQVGAQLAVYEKAMMPRAFEWVRKSSNQQVCMHFAIDKKSWANDTTVAGFG